MIGCLMVMLVCIAIPVAVIGVFLLTQATQGIGAIAIACFLAVLARMAQAEWHLGRASRPPALPAAAAAPRPPSPSTGEKVRLATDLAVREAADPRAAILGTVAAGTLVEVVAAQPGWIFVQSEDGTLEGWGQT